MRPVRASSLAWTALLLGFVLMPLMALVIDGLRLFYADARLQVATDAGCEAAVQVAFEDGVDAFKQTGVKRMKWSPRALQVGRAMFLRTLQGAPVLQGVSFAVHPVGERRIRCVSRGQVSLWFLPRTVALEGWADAEGTFRTR